MYKSIVHIVKLTTPSIALLTATLTNCAVTNVGPLIDVKGRPFAVTVVGAEKRVFAVTVIDGKNEAVTVVNEENEAVTVVNGKAVIIAESIASEEKDSCDCPID